MATRRNGNATRANVPEALAAALLHAQLPADVAAILFANVPELRADCRLWWSTHWPESPHYHPPGKVTEDEVARARNALAIVRDGSAPPPGYVVVSDDGDAAALLHCRDLGPPPVLLEPIGARMTERSEERRVGKGR